MAVVFKLTKKSSVKFTVSQFRMGFISGSKHRIWTLFRYADFDNWMCMSVCVQFYENFSDLFFEGALAPVYFINYLFVFQSIRRLLANNKVRNIDAARLVLLYVLRYERSNSNDIKGLRNELQARGADDTLVKVSVIQH